MWIVVFYYLMDEETVQRIIVCLVMDAVTNTEGDMRVASFTNIKDHLLQWYTVKSRCLQLGTFILASHLKF